MITKYARASEADRYETREAYKNASTVKITYLGDVKSADGKAAAAHCRIYLPSTDDTFLMTLTADRSNPLAFGIWNCTGDEAGDIVKDMGVYSVFNMSPYMNHTKFLWTVGFYSSDPAVTTIRVTTNDKENTLTLDERHFAAFRIPDTENDATEKAPNEILTEGASLDQNGNILYHLQPFERSVSFASSYYEIEWIKT